MISAGGEVPKAIMGADRGEDGSYFEILLMPHRPGHPARIGRPEAAPRGHGRMGHPTPAETLGAAELDRVRKTLVMKDWR
jgi:hypothetical protein